MKVKDRFSICAVFEASVHSALDTIEYGPGSLKVRLSRKDTSDLRFLTKSESRRIRKFSELAAEHHDFLKSLIERKEITKRQIESFIGVVYKTGRVF